jgi:transposase
MTEAITETVGCDLGDKGSELCILLPNGEVQRPESVRTTRKAFAAFFTRPRAHVVIEAGTHSRWVSELLEERGHKVTVANPRRVKLISQGHSKRDVKDAGRVPSQQRSPARCPRSVASARPRV